MKACLAATALCAGLVLPAALAGPAAAQSSLGFSQAEFGIGTTTIDGRSIGAAGLAADFAITGAHGLQFDLAVEDYPTGLLGSITTHLYMHPTTGQKYGLFLQLADVDARDATTVAAGAEGIFDLGPATRAELRGGIGLRSPGSFDFVFAEGRLARRLSAAVEGYAALRLADVDERGFSALGYDARLGLRWWLPGSGLTLDASAGRSGLTGSGLTGSGLAGSGLAGSDREPAETVLALAVTLNLGGPRGAGSMAEERLFSRPAPLGPLQLRGLE